MIAASPTKAINVQPHCNTLGVLSEGVTTSLEIEPQARGEAHSRQGADELLFAAPNRRTPEQPGSDGPPDQGKDERRRAEKDQRPHLSPARFSWRDVEPGLCLGRDLVGLSDSVEQGGYLRLAFGTAGRPGLGDVRGDLVYDLASAGAGQVIAG